MAIDKYPHKKAKMAHAGAKTILQENKTLFLSHTYVM